MTLMLSRQDKSWRRQLHHLSDRPNLGEPFGVVNAAIMLRGLALSSRRARFENAAPPDITYKLWHGCYVEVKTVADWLFT